MSRIFVLLGRGTSIQCLGKFSFLYEPRPILTYLLSSERYNKVSEISCLCLVYVYVIQNVQRKILKRAGTSNSCCYYYSHFVDIEAQAARV